MFCPCAIPDEDTNYEDFMFNLSLLKTGQTLLKAVPFGSYLLIPPVYPPLRSPLLQSWPHSLGHFFFFFLIIHFHIESKSSSSEGVFIFETSQISFGTKSSEWDKQPK